MLIEQLGGGRQSVLPDRDDATPTWTTDRIITWLRDLIS